VYSRLGFVKQKIKLKPTKYNFGHTVVLLKAVFPLAKDSAIMPTAATPWEVQQR
jgi:hypothetical protein